MIGFANELYLSEKDYISKQVIDDDINFILLVSDNTNMTFFKVIISFEDYEKSRCSPLK